MCFIYSCDIRLTFIMALSNGHMYIYTQATIEIVNFFLRPSVKRSKGSTSKLQKSQSRVKSNFLFLPSCHISFTGQICTHRRERERERETYTQNTRAEANLHLLLSPPDVLPNWLCTSLSFQLFRMVMLLSVSFFPIFFSFLFCCPLVTKCVHQIYISLSSLYIFNNAWLEYFRLMLHEVARSFYCHHRCHQNHHKECLISGLVGRVFHSQSSSLLFFPSLRSQGSLLF